MARLMSLLLMIAGFIPVVSAAKKGSSIDNLQKTAAVVAVLIGIVFVFLVISRKCYSRMVTNDDSFQLA